MIGTSSYKMLCQSFAASPKAPDFADLMVPSLRSHLQWHMASCEDGLQQKGRWGSSVYQFLESLLAKASTTERD